MSETQRNRQRQLINAAAILINLVENIRLHRILVDTCANPHLAFWRVIYNAIFDLSVLEWCKLFGSDDQTRQPLHWKNVVSDHDQFRSALLGRLQISKQDWDAYWHEMKRYRDQAIARFDNLREEIPTHPIFDVALQSAYFYFETVIVELKKIGVENVLTKDLQNYGDEFATNCLTIANGLNSLQIGYESILR
jgi:hypothetical protein